MGVTPRMYYYYYFEFINYKKKYYSYVKPSESKALLLT